MPGNSDFTAEKGRIVMKYYSKTSIPLMHASPSVKLMALGSLPAIFGVLAYVLWKMLFELHVAIFGIDVFFGKLYKGLFILAIVMEMVGLIGYVMMPDTKRIKYMLRKNLFSSEFGNPLSLKEGELLPGIEVVHENEEIGSYKAILRTTPRNIIALQNISPDISSSLKGRYKNYAVVWTESDLPNNSVSYILEDVTIERRLTMNLVHDLRQSDVTKLAVQEGTDIDLTTSGSMIVAGKTRSGKTTGIVCLLLQVLQSGADNYGSEVVAVDPKSAELSRLPHVYSPDPDGNAKVFIDALKRVEATRVYRQQILNDLSEAKGDAVHWWEAGMKVSFLFIDEFISARAMLPKRAGKDDPEYSVEVFDNLLKRLITMGASAGVYVILSVAQCSVIEAGLPSLIKEACTTKILFRPTLEEGRLMWSGQNLKDLPERTYLPGEAWFSSTDGKHERISVVQFPLMRFGVYKELGRLLQEYYAAHRRDPGA